MFPVQFSVQIADSVCSPYASFSEESKRVDCLILFSSSYGAKHFVIFHLDIGLSFLTSPLSICYDLDQVSSKHESRQECCLRTLNSVTWSRTKENSDTTKFYTLIQNALKTSLVTLHMKSTPAEHMESREVQLDFSSCTKQKYSESVSESMD